MILYTYILMVSYKPFVFWWIFHTDKYNKDGIVPSIFQGAQEEISK